jgi:hypothetical protein
MGSSTAIAVAGSVSVNLLTSTTLAHVVGSTVQIAGRRVFVTEKGKALIAGGEGQLAFTILPGEEIGYVDGTSGGEHVSIEYAEDEIEVSVGSPVAREELVVDEEVF